MVHLAWAATTSAFKAVERSYPTSKVRGRSWEDPMPKGRQPRGFTPRPRSGVVAKRSYPASKARGGSLEDLPHPRG